MFANAVKDLESRLSGLKGMLNPVTSPGKGRERKQILPHRKGHVETSVKVRAEIKLCFHKPRTTKPPHPTESGKVREGPSPRAFGGGGALPAP